MAEIAVDAPHRNVPRARARRIQSPPPSSRLVNWEMLGVLAALVIQAGAAIWWASGQDAATRELRETTAPLRDGTLARIDERTGRTAKDMDDLKIWMRRSGDRITLLEHPAHR